MTSPRRWAATLLTAGLLAGLVVPGASGASAAPRESRATAPFSDPWWYEGMGLDEVHPEVTGEGAVVALLDRGLQPDVPALRGADIEMMPSPCLSPGSSEDNWKRSEYQRGQEAEHGSVMASLIVGGGEGPGGPGTGIRGAAPDAKLLFFDTGNGYCTGDALADTFQAAADAGADVISASFVTGAELRLVERMPEIAASNEVVVVAANNGTNRAGELDDIRGLAVPAAVPGVLSVNAVDADVQPWEFSLSARSNGALNIPKGWYAPAVSAMGVDVPVPGTSERRGAGATVTGTSPATALAAGVMALVAGRYPDATPNQLVQHAIHWTSRVRNPDPQRPDMAWFEGTGYGMVAAPEMIARDPTVWPDENPLLVQPEQMAQRYPTSLATAAPAASASPSGSPSAEASGGAVAAGEQDAPAEDTSAAEADGPGVVPWLVGGAGVLAAAAIAVAVLRRRAALASDEARPGSAETARAHQTTATRSDDRGA